ncbi:uncharacterized protein GLRG_03684 [Colletotrichum graminicola M1.001]|uniref:Uncharacterized protein n=1 Tax=Colletotrichum graminicola (strain M1.001 / M2 / FGSC 10212) TaxID=645133 RepID=E3QCF2_COLGM|nr:uncharacterized protein GLRG_03684 [Colletotrichum graminicola M1.001]EFQ28540.1 hypothetical protein GLRG_03684 [Colletotrichum graminicola M1.001]
MSSLSSTQLIGNANKINQTCNLVREFFQDEQEHHATVVDEATLRIFLESDKACSLRQPEARDYLSDYYRKKALVLEVKSLINSPNPDVEVATFWATLWTMRTTDVERLLHELRTKNRTMIFRGSTSLAKDNVDNASQRPKRNESAVDLAKQRDKEF